MLARAHRRLDPGTSVVVVLRAVTADAAINWVVGGGFEVLDATADGEGTRVEAMRIPSVPDTVGPGMRLLVCGLNPSLHAAETGVGFSRPGNRFWPAALVAGLVTRDRDPDHALHVHGIGMTDLAKRATGAVSELRPEELRAGRVRVERLVARLSPTAVCVVGLTGWRTTVGREAEAGWQPVRWGGRPVYVMPSTSGRNAHQRLADLAGHLRAALDRPPDGAGTSGSVSPGPPR